MLKQLKATRETIKTRQIITKRKYSYLGTNQTCFKIYVDKHSKYEAAG